MNGGREAGGGGIKPPGGNCSKPAIPPGFIGSGGKAEKIDPRKHTLITGKLYSQKIILTVHLREALS